MRATFKGLSNKYLTRLFVAKYYFAVLGALPEPVENTECRCDRTTGQKKQDYQTHMQWSPLVHSWFSFMPFHTVEYVSTVLFKCSTPLNIAFEYVIETQPSFEGRKKGSGIADNPQCVGVGTMVGGVQCWQCVALICWKILVDKRAATQASS